MKNVFGLLVYSTIEDRQIYENWESLNKNIIIDLKEENLIDYFTNDYYRYDGVHDYSSVISDEVVPRFYVEYVESCNLIKDKKTYNLFIKTYSDYLDFKRFKGIITVNGNEKYIKDIICFKFKNNDSVNKLIEEVNDDFFKTMKPLKDNTRIEGILTNEKIINSYINNYNSENMTFYNIETEETNMFIEPFLMIKNKLDNTLYYNDYFKDKIFIIQNLISYKY